MTESERAEGVQDLEDPGDHLSDGEQALLHFSAYTEARRALPWEQWTSRERAHYYVDRIFIGVLIIFGIMLLGEFWYKMWYVTNVRKIAESVSDSLVWLFTWLFTQERQEELMEL